MPSLQGRLYSRLGAGYFWLFVAFEVVSVMLVCLATVGMFSLYTEMDASEFVEGHPLRPGVHRGGLRVHDLQGRDARPRPSATGCGMVATRRARARRGWRPWPCRASSWSGTAGSRFLIVGLPVSIFFTLEFDLPGYSALIIFGGAAGGRGLRGGPALLRRRAVPAPGDRRPGRAPAGATSPAQPAGVPLRWKLLGALPIVNVITGVVVSGLSTDGTASLEDLGVDVVVALLVAFTISLELTVLVTKSVLRPVDDLLEATKAAAAGRPRRAGAGDLGRRARRAGRRASTR